MNTNNSNQNGPQNKKSKNPQNSVNSGKNEGTSMQEDGFRYDYDDSSDLKQ